MSVSERRADPAAPATAFTDGMVRIPGATFTMGSGGHYPEEAPAHRVTVAASGSIPARSPTASSAASSHKTGYVTVAERRRDPADYPGAQPELLVPFSSVFVPPRHRVGLRHPHNWWTLVPGADWRHPQGPGSSIRTKPGPSRGACRLADVAAYASWAGKDLPTEAEWELAARGGLDGAEFAWGDDLNPGGEWMANTWQGEFPIQNTGDDGYEGTSPVGVFPANGYGLYDMIGNVWEWTADWYAGHPARAGPAAPLHNPRGGARDAELRSARCRRRIPRKVTKGGLFLCAPNYCRRYRPAARMAQAVDTSTCHLGFRRWGSAHRGRRLDGQRPRLGFVVVTGPAR